MKPLCKIVISLAIAAFLLTSQSLVWAESDRPQSGLKNIASKVEATRLDSNLNTPISERITAVIYPYQSATVSSEVKGIVDVLNFKEGDQVEDGTVVAEVSKPRYAAILGEFRGNYDAVVRTLEQARDELKIQQDLYKKRATTYHDLVKARSQVGILEARKHEAEHKMKQAELNLKACVIQAPFSGTFAVAYHESHEAVDDLEKIFELVDTHKVYARANWPESKLSEIALGKKIKFIYKGKTYHGAIEKISSLIDPASKSKRIHVLIDNPDGELQVGMSGILSR